MRKPQGVASLALGWVLHWAFSPRLLNPKLESLKKDYEYSIKGARRESGAWNLHYTTKTLYAEYLTSYTNTLQLIGYQHFT